MYKKLKSRRLAAWFVTLMMLFSIITPFDVTRVFAAENETVDLQILATSDTHGRFMPYDYATDSEDTSGSLAQVATLVKDLKAKNHNTVLVDNGDTIQDNSAALFLNDEVHPMIAAMNQMGYDAWSYGNHEFNYGIPTLNKVAAKFSGASLCGNVFDAAGKPLGKPYTIVERDGIKIGIIGVVTPHITKWDGPNLKGYTVKNPAEESRKIADEIKDKVDVIIVTIHAGVDSEYGNGDSAREVAQKVPEAAAVIAGHAHSKVGEVREGDVVITEPSSGAKYLSKVDIKLTKQNGKYVIADRKQHVKSEVIEVKSYKADEDLKTILNPYHERALADAKTVIGELKGGDLAPASEIKDIPQAQLQPTAMIELINKVQMKYGKADVAAAAVFRNDANMKQGPITKAGTASIYKYDNTLMTLEVTGKQLKKYMEWSASYYNTFKPGDLTISFNQNVRSYNYDMFSGIKYNIDISKEAGNRIKNLTYMDGKPIKDEDKIKLAVNNYRANTTLLNPETGLFKGENVKVLYDSFEEMGDNGRIRDLIRKYIVEEKGGVITPEVNNNWKLSGYKFDANKRALALRLIKEGKIQIPKSEDGRTPNVKAVTWNDVSKQYGTVIDILSFNDFHGALKSEGKNVGAAKLAGDIVRFKGINPNTIVVGAGDLYQGSAMSNLKYGAPVTDVLKYLGLEASAIGNHEFDWGWNKIPNWAKDGGFDFLASNIYDKKTGKPVDWAIPYKVVEKDGKKIGFIGIATPETATKTKPDNVKDFQFRDPVESANYWAKYLKDNEKVDAVVALTHLGSFQDAKTKEVTGEAADLAKASKGIDAIISAHSHQFVDGKVNGIPVVQAMYNGRALANLTFVFGKDGKLTEVMNSVDKLYERTDLVEDPTVKAIYDKYNEDLKPILDVVVATTDKELTHSKGELSILGQLTTKLMAEASKSQIGITNGGGLRRSLNAGNITVGDMYEVMPFDNTLVTMELKGSDLKRVLEHGIMNEQYGWVQFYGVKVYYDKDKPSGERITSMRLLDGTKVDMDKYYKVVTNDFMVSGGDNYNFDGARNIVDTGVPIRDAMIELLKGKNLSYKYEETLIAGSDTAIENPENPTNPQNPSKPSTPSKPVAGKDLPKTGSTVGFDGYVALGALVSLLGLALYLDDKYRKKNNIAA